MEKGTTNKKSRHWFCSSNNQLTNPFKWPKLYDLLPILQPILLTKTSEYFLEEFIFFSAGLSICKAWVVAFQLKPIAAGRVWNCSVVVVCHVLPALHPPHPFLHTHAHMRAHTRALCLSNSINGWFWVKTLLNYFVNHDRIYRYINLYFCSLSNVSANNVQEACLILCCTECLPGHLFFHSWA